MSSYYSARGKSYINEKTEVSDSESVGSDSEKS